MSRASEAKRMIESVAYVSEDDAREIVYPCPGCTQYFGSPKSLAGHQSHCRGTATYLDPGTPVPRRKADGLIYIVRTTEGPRRIKVGFTSERWARQRVRGIQGNCAVALELVGAWHGSTDGESVLHDTLKEWRVHGEWFAGEALSAALRWLDEKGYQPAELDAS